MNDKNTCCNSDCNQGRACPVRAGTHKPAEAVHQIQEPAVNQQLTTEQEPVWGQSRFHGQQWMSCAAEHVTMVLVDPRYAEEGYEARYLYAAPVQAAQPEGPQAETIEEAARDVGKWLNERPNRPLDLRHVAMLAHHAQAAPAAVAVPDERAAFEAWAVTHYAEVNLAREGDGYRYALAKDWWPVWQARAALSATTAAAPNAVSNGRWSAAPVVLPEPAVIATSKRESPVKGSVEFAWGVDALKEEGEHKLFTEQQVRQLLAAQAKQGEQP